MDKLLGGRDGYFIVEKDDGSYRVDRGTQDIRTTIAENLSFEEAIEYLRPKNK